MMISSVRIEAIADMMYGLGMYTQSEEVRRLGVEIDRLRRVIHRAAHKIRIMLSLGQLIPRHEIDNLLEEEFEGGGKGLPAEDITPLLSAVECLRCISAMGKKAGSETATNWLLSHGFALEEGGYIPGKGFEEDRKETD